jgi:hypothetical protein
LFRDENGLYQSVTDRLEVHIRNSTIGPEKKKRKHNKTSRTTQHKVRSERASFHGAGPDGAHLASDLGYLAIGVRERAPLLRDAQPAHIRELVAGILQDDGHQVRLARDGAEAIDAVRRRRPSLVILDIWLQGSDIDGLDLLTMLKEIDPDMPVVVTMLFINIGLGITTRAAPALNIFSVGFPALLLAGFAVMMMSLPSMGSRIQWLWLQGLQQVNQLLGIA